MKLSFCFRVFRVFRGSLQLLKPKSKKDLNNHGTHRIHGNENGERISFTALRSSGNLANRLGEMGLSIRRGVPKLDAFAK